MAISPQNIFRRHIALPQDHGSWVFLLSPLLIGIFASESAWSISTLLVILAAMAAFLIRQPVTVAIKVYSNRRSRRDLPAAWFWMVVYGLIGLMALVGLMIQGYGYLLYLAVPAIPVFIWHLVLVSRRAERRQIGVEIIGSGTLALAAPAGYWIGVGQPDPVGWWLFLLTWFQSAASIVYAYARLEQRELETYPSFHRRLLIGQRALLYTGFNLLAVTTLAIGQIIPPFLPMPYLLQFCETIYGTLIKPAFEYKPTVIGIRQLFVSTIFTILFILAWNYAP